MLDWFTQLKFIEVDIDIDFYYVPCDLLLLHMHGDNSRNKLEWFHFQNNTNTLPFDLNPTFESALQGWKDKRGCKVRGTLFHDYGAMGFGFMWNNYNGWLMEIVKQEPRSVDFSHKINYLYLGSQSMHAYLEEYS